jgi:GT2 family glycosyltransferase
MDCGTGASEAVRWNAVYEKVSVVVVSWNSRDYLRECLESLKKQVYQGELEVIVVDNASEDGSPDMVREQFPHVLLICNSENLGFARANNIGIRACTGVYIALVNSDVHVLDACFTKLVDWLATRSEVGLIGPLIMRSDGEQQRSCRAEPSLWNMWCRALALDAIFPHSPIFCGYFMGHWSHGETAPVDILSGCFWLTSRRALSDVGLLDESFFIYGEDMDWCKRFRDAGWEVVFVTEARAVHYGGGSSMNSPVRFFVEKQKADLKYWHKHHSRLAVAMYIVTCIIHHTLRIVGYSLKALVSSGDTSVARYKVRRSAACLHMFLGLP